VSEIEDLRQVALTEIAGDQMLGGVFAVWEAKRDGKFAPHPSDVGALALPVAALPRVVLVDAMDDGVRFRFRLVGSAVALSSGTDFTGKFVDEALTGWVPNAVVADYRRVVTEKRPAYAVAQIRLPDGQVVRNSRLALPLSSDGAAVDRLMLVSRTTADWLLRADLQNLAAEHTEGTTRSVVLL
jgi:hypothetical protein